ncbi:hypothetical protein Tcan_18740, partial [Toxocara canis]
VWGNIFDNDCNTGSPSAVNFVAGNSSPNEDVRSVAVISHQAKEMNEASTQTVDGIARSINQIQTLGDMFCFLSKIFIYFFFFHELLTAVKYHRSKTTLSVCVKTTILGYFVFMISFMSRSVRNDRYKQQLSVIFSGPYYKQERLLLAHRQSSIPNVSGIVEPSVIVNFILAHVCASHKFFGLPVSAKTCRRRNNLLMIVERERKGRKGLVDVGTT